MPNFRITYACTTYVTVDLEAPSEREAEALFETIAANNREQGDVSKLLSNPIYRVVEISRQPIRRADIVMPRAEPVLTPAASRESSPVA